MNTTYRKNLKDVAIACKNYVDTMFNNFRWELGSHTLDVTTDTDTKYLKSVPSDTIGCQINKVGGMSYKSENLLNLAEGENGFIDDSGSVVYRDTQFVSDYIQVFSGKTYIVKTSQNFNTIGVAYFDTSKNISLPRNDNNAVSQVTISPSANGYIRIWFKLDNSTSLTSSIQETYSIMLNEGSVALPYQPYFEGIRNSAVTQITLKDSNNETKSTISIPSAIQNLDGYGWGIDDPCYNYIDYERKVFVQKVGRVDLSTLTFESLGNNAYVASNIGIKPAENNGVPINAVCTTYNVVSYNALASDTTTTQLSGYTSDRIYVRDTSGTPNGMLYYELATPVETDISAYLTTDTVDVEGGGSLEFTNAYNNDVPSDIDYLIEEVKA